MGRPYFIFIAGHDMVYLVMAALIGIVMLVVGGAKHIDNQIIVNMPLLIWVASTDSYLSLIFLAVSIMSCSSSMDTSAGIKAADYRDSVEVSAGPFCLELGYLLLIRSHFSVAIRLFRMMGICNFP